ncbi:hypothetical protein AMATHDRAFT_76346 [Amanita thiersii Skay4041]|uniref:[histone H3]-trimethyl-L-lysine(9) demethylase n=1 Tax=Amanita thiersii Skay4041 TaxID=703135 RepID=A0A2A9NGG5_9AGAR|nr:hypothetical protein AMATHDRAFT_76346 [Amanita thiersii Skay4041]
MSTTSSTITLTPSRSTSPQLPVQPDHFYGSANIQLPPSPHSDGRTWLRPEDDPLAHRGIPVFKPSMKEFEDFEQFMIRIESWGMRSGIVKVIPPKEWTDGLPPLKTQLEKVKIKTPIEQHMLGRGGLFRQENMEKRKVMSAREWLELCNKEDFRAPGIDDVGLHARSANVKPRVRKTKKKADLAKAESAEPDMGIKVKEEPVDDEHHSEIEEHPLSHREGQSCVASPPDSVVEGSPVTPNGEVEGAPADAEIKTEDKSKPKGRRTYQSKEAREASLADRAQRDLAFLETFDPQNDWLPPNTKPSDYTPEFCQKLERQFWRNCGLGRPAWYGADMQGSLYTETTKSWNVASLPSTLSRLLPSDRGLPGVNTPYLYFGMWRATFAWHVEDMDLFSINYIHFGAPKFWYAVPQGRASALEQTMRGYFPKDTSRCPQFLRHKSFLASPTLLAQSSCRPNYLVQHAGEFVITYPRGYHAGFNLGINCAESVNFALDSWIELGKKAKACQCINDSVRIDVEQLLRDHALGAEKVTKPKQPKGANEEKEISKLKKRKSDGLQDSPKPKKPKTKQASTTATIPEKPTTSKVSLTIKLNPRSCELEQFPCCLCVSTSKEGLLRVHDPPIGRKDAEEATGKPKEWMAHEGCANVIPETWVDGVEKLDGGMERCVFGVDAIVKDRWNLKCSLCTKNRNRAHGAPVQCTKGKCPKAFHVSCARDGHEAGVIFTILREVEKEVVLIDPVVETLQPAQTDAFAMQIDQSSIGQGSTQPVNSANDVSEAACVSMIPAARVLKIIKKQEVETLCSQHNPILAGAKRANKLDKIRSDLLALPSMARIKIRVSAGVFEVSLLRVIEETKSVEVLWDRGIKREFKWGSVVFGSTGATVQQKPSEPLAEPEPGQTVPVQTFSANTTGTVFHPPSGPMTGQHPYATGTQYYYPPRPGAYEYWPYQGTGSPYAAGATHPYYAGYYATAGAMNHSAYMYAAHPYQSGRLTWQQPYQGPRSDVAGDSAKTGQSLTVTSPVEEIQSSSGEITLAGGSEYAEGSNRPASPGHGAPTMGDAHEGEDLSAIVAPMQTEEDKLINSSANEQGFIKDLVALSTMQPTEIANALRDNPQLREIVLAAIDEAKKTATAAVI